MAKIELKKIMLDGGTQTRSQLNFVTIADYQKAMEDRAQFPPIVVFYDGSQYWLADGFHRCRAAVDAGLTEIEAEVKQGTRRDAILYSVGANATHGLPRTREDKRTAVMLLLEDEEWGRWSDREIARLCIVHHQLVGNLRKTFSLDDSSSEKKYITKHGTVSTMNTANIGGKATAPEPSVSQTSFETTIPGPGQVRILPGTEDIDDDDDDDIDLIYNGEDYAYCKYCYTTHQGWEMDFGDYPISWRCNRCGHHTADELMSVQEEPPQLLDEEESGEQDELEESPPMDPAWKSKAAQELWEEEELKTYSSRRCIVIDPFLADIKSIREVIIYLEDYCDKKSGEYFSDNADEIE
jgi:hypothetical protein